MLLLSYNTNNKKFTFSTNLSLLVECYRKKDNFVNGFFEEYGTTGIRESNVFAMYRKDHPDEEDPFKGWSRDPYDASFTKGFLRNLSEHQQFDRFCPGHPLSLARAYVDYIINNN